MRRSRGGASPPECRDRGGSSWKRRLGGWDESWRQRGHQDLDYEDYDEDEDFEESTAPASSSKAQSSTWTGASRARSRTPSRASVDKRSSLFKEWSWLHDTWWSEDTSCSDKQYHVTWTSDVLGVKIVKGGKPPTKRIRLEAWFQGSLNLVWAGKNGSRYILETRKATETVLTWHHLAQGKLKGPISNVWVRQKRKEEGLKEQQSEPLIEIEESEEEMPSPTSRVVRRREPVPSTVPRNLDPFAPQLPLQVTIISYGIQLTDIEADLKFDVRHFRDPMAGDLRGHDGHHPEIIGRITEHRDFPSWLRIIKRAICKHAGCEQLRVGFFCKAGRHRSVAATLMMEHILEQEGVPVMVEHAVLKPCQCNQCGRDGEHERLEKLDRAWQTWQEQE